MCGSEGQPTQERNAESRVTSEVFAAMARAVAKQGGTIQSVYRIMHDECLQEHIAQLLMQTDAEAATQPKAEVLKAMERHGESPRKNASAYTAYVEYVQPGMKELLRRFDCVNSEFRSRTFESIEPCKDVDQSSRVVDFDLVHFDHNATAEDVLCEMRRRGLRPALYEELLGFTEHYPDEQCEHPIVALGSASGGVGGRYVVYAWHNGSERGLYQCWSNKVDWHQRYRFLAVRD